jgi:hypothetical protein
VISEISSQSNGRMRFRARVADTTPISAYGGVQLSLSTLQGLKRNLEEKTIQFSLEHDPARPIELWIVESEIISVTPHHQALLVTAECTLETFETLPKESDGYTLRGGISVSVTEPISARSESSPVVVIAADANNWTDRDLIETGQQVISTVPLSINRLFQFSTVPAALVVLEVLKDVGFGVISNILYELMRRSRTKPVTFSIKIKSSEKYFKCVLKASDFETLESGIDALKTEFWKN